MRKPVLAAVVASLLVLAGCSGGPVRDSGDSPSEQPEAAEARYFGGAAEEPRATESDKDTFSFAAMAEPQSLDPVINLGSGATGGNELGAVFDTLVTQNPQTGEMEPQLVESYSYDGDGTRLELKLRQGVTFSDGTPFNAEAVIFSLQRHIEMHSGYETVVAEAVKMEAADEHTVVLHFAKPNYPFINVLATVPGAIVSPTAVRERGDKFSTQPVGAGPYIVESWAPADELVLTANPDYWGGEPPIKNLRFVYLDNLQAGWESLQQGNVDAMFTLDPEVAGRIYDEGQGFTDPIASTRVFYLNSAEGFTTSDPRLRRAIALALDAELFKKLAGGDGGIATKSLVPQGAPLHGKESTLQYDPAAAKALVDEVKAEGNWDGSIEVMCNATAEERDMCLAVEGMLNAVGFKVTTEFARDKIAKLFSERDFEVANSVLTGPGPDFFSGIKIVTYSTSPWNVLGYNNPEFDAALDNYQAAPDLAAQREALIGLQEAFDADPPYVILASDPGVTAWTPEVSGLIPAGASGTVRFDKVVITE